MARRWLLVDIGNSRVKWAVAEDGGWRVGTPFPSAPATLADQLDRHWLALTPPGALYVANVAGAGIAGTLGAWVARHWRVPVHFARAEAQAQGVTNGYQRPEQLGVDRWVGLLALRREYPLPAALVDCGTALTFDLLDGDGRHLGGLIAPGPATMRRVLLRETHGVREVERQTPGFLGRDTAAGVAGGVIRACAGLVEKSLVEAAGLVGGVPILVLAGGDAAELGRCLAIPYRLAPDLVLRGLSILAESDP